MVEIKCMNYPLLSLSNFTWEAEKFDNVSLEISLRSFHFHEASMLCAAWKMKAKVRTARDTTFRIYYIFFFIFLQALHVSLSLSSFSRPVCYKAKYHSSHQELVDSVKTEHLIQSQFRAHHFFVWIFVNFVAEYCCTPRTKRKEKIILNKSFSIQKFKQSLKWAWIAVKRFFSHQFEKHIYMRISGFVFK